MKAFVIHLPEIAQSREFATELQTGLRSRGIDAELFSGVPGDQAVEITQREKKQFSTQAFAQDANPRRWEKKSSRPGVLGCFLSHYKLWQHCVEINEPIMIFEDDVILYRGFEPVTWNQVLILSVCTEWTERSEKYLGLLDDHAEPAQALEFQEFCLPGTSGYAITPAAAEKLVLEYQNSYAPSDHAIHKNLVDIQIHSHLLGRSRTPGEGKESLTRNTSIWKH